MSDAVFIAHSRCECQASLRAELDEHRQVLRGTAFLRGLREVAPSQAIHAGPVNLDIHWSCPFCIRNILRSFTVAALQRVPRAAA